MPPESGLKHKPFSSLSNAAAAAPSPAQKPRSSLPQTPAPLGRIIVREEDDAVEATIITRVIGLPVERLAVLGKQWRATLGKTVAIEGRDLLVIAPESERVAALLREAGASEVVVIQRPAKIDLESVGEQGGTVRSQIRRGLRVAIVQKADQGSGTLTEGIVADLLTSAPTHPRGIKVRLESGEVGRVRRILAR